MTPEAKKRVRRYGIPIDLVILATGAAMLFGAPSGGTLTILYLLAVAVSAVRLGWRSGLTAAIFGFVVMTFGFGANVRLAHEITFLALSAAITWTAAARRRLKEPAAERLQLEEEERKIEEERQAAERAAAERAAREREKQERAAAERAAREREEQERAAAARRIEEERLAAERAARAREEQERAAAERAAAERAAQERVAALEREKEELARKLEAEREQAKRDAEKMLEERLAAERAELQKKYEEQLRAEREALAKTKPAPAPAPAPKKPAPSGPGVFSTLTSWLKTPQRSKPAVVNLKSKKAPAPVTAPRARPQMTRERRPRILMLERRRGTADAVAPRLREMGIEVQIVDRWIDAVDEIFRFRPDAMFVDAELPDFARVHKSIVEQAPRLPIFVTAGSHGALPNVARAASVIRPYSAEGVAKLAREAMTAPQAFLDRQVVRGASAPSLSRPVPIPLGPPPEEKAEAVVAPVAAVAEVATTDRYDVVCFNCRVAFDATDADWCSCLTKERTLVCTNCLTCFCKAPPAYKEKFWVEAPPRLFERKTAELRKQQGSVAENATPEQIKRPLVMLVEDDEDIQTIVRRVCSNLGYGFVTASNGQDGLTLARLYKPNLILSDAFMPKLDGREMCRILKEESVIPDCKMIVMTGLYTDTKYKTEALKRFHIDDYLSKPVSITDLINLLQKHLEGVTSAPPQEDLHELHRKEVEHEITVDDFLEDRGVPLADLLEAQEERTIEEPRLPIAASRARSQAKTYEVCCFTCGKTFDATQAEWCTCLGRDQTLVCPHCSTCFCKSPAAYKERFWMDAPSMLFERKMIGSKRNVSGKNNPSPMEVKRPLILLVEDDENIQLIVKTVVTSMGYGFIVAANGQEGLAMAREYNPDLILSDAFMPKLDGREMCRLLKEDPATARTKAIIMTGLYTDRKYRNEALSYFKVDDYVAKPVAVDDLIKLMKKHLPQEVQPTM